MTRVILSAVAGVALALGLCTAQAADLTKAPPPPAKVQFSCGVTTTCIGPYVGVDVSGLNANFTSFLPGASGPVGGGDMTLGVHGGFQYWNGQYFAAFDVQARASMAQNLNAVGGTFNDRWTFFQTVKAGANLAQFFNIPQTSAPANPSASGPVAGSGFTIPANLLSMLTSAYLQFGAAERFSKTGYFTGAGVQLLLSANWTADIDYKHIMWNGAQAGTTLQLDTEDVAEIGFSYHFGSGSGLLGL